jgi:hypothetical protein
MNYSVYPTHDTTIYERSPTRNSGIDQIIEILKNVPNIPDPEDGFFWEGIYNSRILIKFDTQELTRLVNSGVIARNANYYLSLKAVDAVNVPIEYTLDVYAVSQSWDNGQGHYFDYPQITTGASWVYRDGFYGGTGTRWVKQSLAAGTTASYATVQGGGTWYTGSNFYASQSFNYAQTPDIRIPVTNIVHQWLSGSIANNGFIIKKTDQDEKSITYTGNIKFFGRDTHTIYIPKLEATWDDSTFTNTGSLQEVSSEYSIGIPNIKKQYKSKSKEVFRVVARDKYPQLTYSTTNDYLQFKRLPVSTYYAIQDTVTEDFIINFDENSTRLSIDQNGSFFRIDMRTFLPERFYKILFKVVKNNGFEEDIIDDGFYFKVMR